MWAIHVAMALDMSELAAPDAGGQQVPSSPYIPPQVNSHSACSDSLFLSILLLLNARVNVKLLSPIIQFGAAEGQRGKDHERQRRIPPIPVGA